MTDGMRRLAELECKRLCESVDDGRMTCLDAVGRAFALGAEFERLDAMHRACEDYSRARAEREEAFNRDTKRPSKPPPKGAP